MIGGTQETAQIIICLCEPTLLSIGHFNWSPTEKLVKTAYDSEEFENAGYISMILYKVQLNLLRELHRLHLSNRPFR